MLLRCTQKFITELRLKKLDEWYAHIFYLYPRRKCAIFMSAETKFCFFAYDRKREQLVDIQGLFSKGLGRALFDEHYPAPVIKLFNERLENFQIGLAQDRRILGFMNQRVQELKFMADHYPDDLRVHDETLAGLASRRSPMVKEKQSYAIEQMRDVLLGCSELKGIEISPAGDRQPVLERFFEGIRAGRSREGGGG